MWSQIYNGNEVIDANAISFLQVIQNDFARLESKTTEAESEVLRIFDEFTGKAVEGVWDSVETDTYDSHRRENSTRVILNTLSVTQDIDQAGGLRRYKSQVVGKNQQLFACTVNGYAGN